MKHPTSEQYNALRRYSRDFTLANWRSLLIDDWRTGRDATSYEYGHLLRQIRNNFGPSWLVTFKPSP